MKKIKQNVLSYALLCMLFTSCTNKSQSIVETCISRDAEQIKSGKHLLTTDSTHYFRDIELTDHFCFFVDTEHEVTLHAYAINDFSKPCPRVPQANPLNQRIVPSLCKSIPHAKGDENVLTIINNANQKRIVMSKKSLMAETTKLKYFRGLEHSITYYVTKDEIYGAPNPRYRTSPFYFYNTNSGYYWVDTEPKLKSLLGNIPVAHMNNICVNENANVVASAYRFTNRLSFYDLKGTLISSIQCGLDTIIPVAHPKRANKIDVGESIKCFIDLYGTEKYLYCLYAGTAYFSEPSKIMVFRWDGSHVKTWQIDRHIASFAVEKSNNYMIGIAANEKGGQDVIRYPINL